MQLIDIKHPVFPNPLNNSHREDGLIAVSEVLTPQMIKRAYQQGIFPWYCDEQFVYWFATQPRFVLQPENLMISRSLNKTLRNHSYRITLNYAFDAVIQHCAAIKRPNQKGTWITPDFQAAYCALHQQGYAHSFECWLPENNEWRLVGGFYGVQIGRIFYGESMFALMPDASKIAFASAVPFMKNCGIVLIDCQQETQHLARFGAELMPFERFQAALYAYNPQPLTLPFSQQIIVEHISV